MNDPKTLAVYMGRPVTAPVSLEDLVSELQAVRAAVQALPESIAAAISAAKKGSIK